MSGHRYVGVSIDTAAPGFEPGAAAEVARILRKFADFVECGGDPIGEHSIVTTRTGEIADERHEVARLAIGPTPFGGVELVGMAIDPRKLSGMALAQDAVRARVDEILETSGIPGATIEALLAMMLREERDTLDRADLVRIRGAISGSEAPPSDRSPIAEMSAKLLDRIRGVL